MHKQVTIQPVPMKSADARGSVHFFDTERSGEYMIFYRKAGAVGANHYHKGLSANKNPEQFILVSGEATLNWRDLNTNETGTSKLISPVEVHIYPWIWHQVTADTDFVMLELNALEEGPADTFYLENQ